MRRNDEPQPQDLRRVGIDEVEALPHQGLFVVQNHAVQVDERLGIDEDADIFELVDAVALTGLRIEADVVGQPEQPPPWTPRRSPPSSGEMPSLAIALRMCGRARSVT
jgi:hypothetical protein